MVICKGSKEELSCLTRMARSGLIMRVFDWNEDVLESQSLELTAHRWKWHHFAFCDPSLQKVKFFSSLLYTYQCQLKMTSSRKLRSFYLRVPL